MVFFKGIYICLLFRKRPVLVYRASLFVVIYDLLTWIVRKQNHPRQFIQPRPVPAKYPIIINYPAIFNGKKAQVPMVLHIGRLATPTFSYTWCNSGVVNWLVNWWIAVGVSRRFIWSFVAIVFWLQNFVERLGAGRPPIGIRSSIVVFSSVFTVSTRGGNATHLEIYKNISQFTSLYN